MASINKSDAPNLTDKKTIHRTQFDVIFTSNDEPYDVFRDFRPNTQTTNSN